MINKTSCLNNYIFILNDIFFLQNVRAVRMDRTVVTLVDSVSMTPSVTTSTVAVHRGVVQGTGEISVQKVWYIYGYSKTLFTCQLEIK